MARTFNSPSPQDDPDMKRVANIGAHTGPTENAKRFAETGPPVVGDPVIATEAGTAQETERLQPGVDQYMLTPEERAEWGCPEGYVEAWVRDPDMWRVPARGEDRIRQTVQHGYKLAMKNGQRWVSDDLVLMWKPLSLIEEQQKAIDKAHAELMADSDRSEEAVADAARAELLASATAAKALQKRAMDEMIAMSDTRGQSLIDYLQQPEWLRDVEEARARRGARGMTEEERKAEEEAMAKIASMREKSAGGSRGRSYFYGDVQPKNLAPRR